MDIDYQVLRNAFFKYQTKPKLSIRGDLYHEGKKFEVKLREMKPSMLSNELKEAFGIPDGALPPWLISMQRYGPPPSYPHLKIPGFNSPIPSVDEHGLNYEDEPVDRSKHWRDLEEKEEEEEEKLRNQKEDFRDMVAEVEKKRKRKMHEKEGKSKKKGFKF